MPISPPTPASAETSRPRARRPADLPKKALDDALRALGLRAVVAIGTSPDGPLRVTATDDVDLEVSRAQQHSPRTVAAHVELYMAPVLANRMRDAVLERARSTGALVRGSWIAASAAIIEAQVRHEAAALGPAARITTPADRMAQAVRIAERRIGR